MKKDTFNIEKNTLKLQLKLRLTCTSLSVGFSSQNSGALCKPKLVMQSKRTFSRGTTRHREWVLLVDPCSTCCCCCCMLKSSFSFSLLLLLLLLSLPLLPDLSRLRGGSLLVLVLVLWAWGGRVSTTLVSSKLVALDSCHGGRYLWVGRWWYECTNAWIYVYLGE